MIVISSSSQASAVDAAMAVERGTIGRFTDLLSITRRELMRLVDLTTDAPAAVPPHSTGSRSKRRARPQRADASPPKTGRSPRSPLPSASPSATRKSPGGGNPHQRARASPHGVRAAIVQLRSSPVTVPGHLSPSVVYEGSRGSQSLLSSPGATPTQPAVHPSGEAGGTTSRGASPHHAVVHESNRWDHRDIVVEEARHSPPRSVKPRHHPTGFSDVLLDAANTESVVAHLQRTHVRDAGLLVLDHRADLATKAEGQKAARQDGFK